MLSVAVSQSLVACACAILELHNLEIAVHYKGSEMHCAISGLHKFLDCIEHIHQPLHL